VALSAVGALVLVVGLLILLGQVTAETRDGRFLLAGAVGCVGGLLLIFLDRLRIRPTAAGCVVTVAAAGLGTGAGAYRRVVDTCCTYAYLVSHGYPFTWLRRGATGETAADAREGALRSTWHLHGSPLVADLLFWGLVGMLLSVAAALARRARRRAAPPSGDDPDRD
jgi:hypothetical protein